MTTTTVIEAPTSPTYALGHSVHEQRRLDRQGALLRPATERWLRDAGIRPGMRVLDIGCGTGDVTRIAAELVGPTGSVLGIDRAPEVIATARRASGAFPNVAFAEADINAFTTDDGFDALIGRLVLMYQPDPATTVRRLRRFVQPGGVVAFADYLFLPLAAIPERPLAAQVLTWIAETLRRSAPNCDLGARLHRVFVDAGLPAPTVRLEIIAGAGCDPEFERMPVDVLRSLLPLAERLGITTAAEAEIDTLEARLLAEAATANGLTFGSVFATAASR